jgi:hypothetical protein
MSPSTSDGAQTTAEVADWQGRTRIFLRPIAAPSVLGLFGFAAATFIVSAHLAGWYGGRDAPPFAAAFGGIAQFAAAMWGYLARDAIATAMHGMWGAFWIAFGVLFLLVATGTIRFEGEKAFDSFASPPPASGPLRVASGRLDLWRLRLARYRSREEPQPARDRASLEMRQVVRVGKNAPTRTGKRTRASVF